MVLPLPLPLPLPLLLLLLLPPLLLGLCQGLQVRGRHEGPQFSDATAAVTAAAAAAAAAARGSKYETDMTAYGTSKLWDLMAGMEINER
jgi:hypothetical protein